MSSSPPAERRAPAAPGSRLPAPRRATVAVAVGLGALLVWQIATARGGTPDPTETQHLSHGAVVVDSALLVFREGLEFILVLAAITAG